MVEKTSASGLEDMETYFLRRKNTIAQYITTSPILELCLEVERKPGVRVVKIWWEKVGLYLGITQAEARAAERTVGL